MPNPIAPNSQVWLLRDVPLDQSYTHTLFFENEAAQRNTFLRPNGWIIRHFTNQMYKRINMDRMRVYVNVESIYNCNYMCFVNNKFPSTDYPNGKMFYAFVTSVNYVAENTTEIEYVIDVMQTYLFDYEMAQCLVEREHTVTDFKYEHTMPEPLALGEYLIDNIPANKMTGKNVTLSDGQSVDMFNRLGFFVVATSMPEFTGDENDPNALGSPSYTVKKANCDIYTGILTGTYTQAFYLHGDGDSFDLLIGRMNAYLTMIDSMGYSDGVVNIYCAPLAFWWGTADVNTEHDERYTSAIGYTLDITPREIVNRKTLKHPQGDHRVLNNKCYSYPFNFLLAVSSDGQSYEYKYELSGDVLNTLHNYFRFNVSGTVNADAEFLLRPRDYRQSPSLSLNNEDTVHCLRTPICSWNSDTYKCWLAQHKTGMITGAIGDAVSAAGNFVKKIVFTGNQGAASSGGGEGGEGGQGVNKRNRIGKAGIDLGVSVVRIATGIIGEIGDAKALPNTPRGDTSGVMDIANRTFGFRFYYATVRPEYMEVIDDFFTKFGYCVNELKIPSRNNRPEFTYLKTAGCEIRPNSQNGRSCNSQVAKDICAIYDNGITFWNNWRHVGDYTVTNFAPVSP